MTQAKFPVGGPRQPVYDYMQTLGFTMAKHSDKQWARGDGLTANIYGAGSMVRLARSNGQVKEMSLDMLDDFLRNMRW